MKTEKKKLPFWTFYVRTKTEFGIEYGAVYRECASQQCSSRKTDGRSIQGEVCKGENEDETLTPKQSLALRKLWQIPDNLMRQYLPTI